MEGPSLYLAKEQLKPFKGKKILQVEGNTKIGKERFEGLVVKDIFSWGKHLVFQFDTFALRVHFMLFGTFEARVGKTWVTGDYRRARVARLAFTFKNGVINMYNCSLKFIESASAKKTYDFTSDIMSAKWDPEKAFEKTRGQPTEEVADVLLDQEIFAGVGNIVKNEVLSRQRISPLHNIKALTNNELRALIKDTRTFSKLFYRLRKKFMLRKSLKVHRRGACPYCGGKLIRAKTGKRQRWSYWCPLDQT